MGFTIRSFKTKDEEDFETGGREGFMTEGGEGLRMGSCAGFTPHGPRIFDLMSLKYARGWHLTNLHFTSSSSELRPGRTPENYITKPELEIPKDFKKLAPIEARENSHRLSGVVQEVGTLSVSSSIGGIIFPITATKKKIAFLSKFMGGCHVENN